MKYVKNNSNTIIISHVHAESYICTRRMWCFDLCYVFSPVQQENVSGNKQQESTIISKALRFLTEAQWLQSF